MAYQLGRLIVVVALAPFVRAADARATYSVLVADTETKQLGFAAASCAPFEIEKYFAIEPGHAVVAAQAYASERGLIEALRLVREGLVPGRVIEELEKPSFDADFRLRQYGIVSVDGLAATYSGSGIDPWAGSRTGRSGTLVYAIQGNLLTSARVIAQMEAELRTQEAGKESTMAERLLRLLEAGARNGQGDVRCQQYGIPATAVALRVQSSTGVDVVRRSILLRTGEDPVRRLSNDLAGQSKTKSPCYGPEWWVVCGVAALTIGFVLYLARAKARSKSDAG